MIRPDMTEAILRCISSHLSARRGCREIEYKVNIYDDGKIVMFPKMYVFPDSKHRKSADRQDIVSHILIDHCDSRFVNIIENESGEMHSWKVDTEYITPGSYSYEFSSTRKSRRWNKVI